MIRWCDMARYYDGEAPGFDHPTRAEADADAAVDRMYDEAYRAARARGRSDESAHTAAVAACEGRMGLR